jgi:hypothetical protein
VKGFNFKKPSDLDFRKQYQIQISKSFAALENLNDSKYMNRTWGKIKEKIKYLNKRV